MLTRILTSCLPLFLVLTSAYGQAAQNRNATSSLDGSVVIPNNEPMQRYDVLLLAKDGEREFAHTYTDLTGRYRFDGVVPGIYDVVVRIEGFEEARWEARLTAGMRTTVNMILEPKAAIAVIPDEWETGVVNIEELTRKFSKKAVDDFQKASEAKRKGDLAKAEELLEGLLKSSADFYEAHNLLGTVYQAMNRFREAEKQYNLSRNLSPGAVEPLVDLATLYLQEAEANQKEGPFVTGVMYDDALHILQEAAHKDPRNATIFYLFGVTFYRSHSYRIAEASFKEALSINSRMGMTRLALANVYIQQHEWKQALDQFDSYLSENPKAANRSQVEAIRAKVIQQL